MPSSKDFMDAEICSMWTSLFQNDSIYFLPKYQRAYSWGKGQLDDFWHDIHDAIAENIELPYLLGTLYLAEVDSRTIEKEVNFEVWGHYENNLNLNKHYLIIDGQQRITTLFLLQLALLGNQNLSVDLLPKLALGNVDFDFLKVLSQNGEMTPLTNSHKNIEFTYNYFNKKITLLSDNEREVFISFVQENLQAVFITLTSNLELATTLFVSQTDRGKKLTVLDKLKSSLMFYTQKTTLRGSLGIDDLFGDLYVNIEYLVSMNVYKNSKEMELDIVRILHVLLKKNKFYDNATLGELKSKIGWEIGEDRVYDAISVMLRDSKRDKKETCILSLHKTLTEIKDFFNYIYQVRKQEQENQFLDLYTHSIWYPYLQLFRILKPTRFSKALFVELFSKSTTQINNKINFISIGDQDTRSDSMVKMKKRSSVDVLTKDRINAKYLKLQTLLSKNGSNYHDIIQIQNNNALLRLLQQKLNRTLERINDFQYYLDNRYISIVNLIEKTEMSIWKNGKRPVGSFIKYEKNADKLLSHTLDFTYRYKEDSNYLLRDFGFSNVKYLLLEYERMVFKNNNNYKKILDIEINSKDHITIHREHVYPVNPDENESLKIKDIWYANNQERYDQWIWKIGNITLLEHNINIGNAANKSIWEKAEIYHNHKTLFLHTRELADDIMEIKTLLNKTGISEDDYLTHYSFKILLEIRELELLAFLYCRF